MAPNVGRNSVKGGMARKIVAVGICFLAYPATTVPQAPNSPPPAVKVEIDNDHVRVVRRFHAPREKVPMHSHPDSVVVYLTEVRQLSTDSNGKTTQVNRHAGDVIWSPAHSHSFVNLADTPIEAIEIEIKPAAEGSSRNSRSWSQAVHRLDVRGAQKSQ
jgi:quercetin dioxygenase-like cupin family protein